MAKEEVKKEGVSPKRPAPKKYVTQEDLKGVTDVMASIADVVGKLYDKVNAEPVKPLTPEETKREVEVKAAAPDVSLVNPAWQEKAVEIIGEALDHCEVFYPKHGGTIFTLVIKESASNAPIEYLERHKADRRSKEIGNEGIEGVESWCKLVKENLKRGR